MKKAYSIFAIAVLFIAYYIFLPPINPRSISFWLFLLFAVGLFTPKIISISINGEEVKPLKSVGYPAYIIIAIIAVIGIGLVTQFEIFNAKRYANLITITESSFNEDIHELAVNQIPSVDRDSAERLGSRKMGELVELVSQFDIDPSYTQINLNDRPVRVTPLVYGNFFKWLSNNGSGIPSYIKVDMIDGSVELVKLTDNIKYSHSDMFFRDITRHLRFKFPTKIFGYSEFEIDEAGTPYWITRTYAKNIGFFGGCDVNGAVLTNASTGESTFYEVANIPQWVDRVYAAEDIISQLNYNGLYKNGWLNSKLSQKGVLATTDGYNYLALDDDVYLYTGITSVTEDASNIGFVMVNLRTKETKFYKVSSAEEFSAMQSTEGEFQEKNYVATFPILLNIKGKPTYFLSLKDNAGLIKRYAFVDASDYQRVYTGTTVQNAYNNLLGRALETGNSEDVIADENVERKTSSGTISSIKEIVIDGNTHFVITLNNDDATYLASIKTDVSFVTLKKGDNVTIEYTDSTIKNVISITK